MKDDSPIEQSIQPNKMAFQKNMLWKRYSLQHCSFNSIIKNFKFIEQF